MIINSGKIKIYFILIIAIIFTVIALFFIDKRYKTVIVTIPKFVHEAKNPTPTSAPSISYKLQATSLLLPVPFTPQAPTANWDELHNEACEEAGAIMANAYYSSSTEATLKPAYVENEITKLTLWQDKTFGYHLDTTIAETSQMIREVYGLQTKLVENFTADDIKKALIEGKLVLISENGRLLGNPYYKSPGPIHHMLLIKGFDDMGNFITNDSGTKRGLNYHYTFDVLFSAAADWSHETNTVDQTKKIAIIVWK